MILQYNLRATDIKNYLNENYNKKSGNSIEMTDVQGYIKRKCTPKWLGNLIIERSPLIKNVSLYHLKTRD